MDSQESSHAAARLPGPAFRAPASPASAEPQKRQSVSTKLAHDQDAENPASESSSSPENPSKALRWFQTNVVTPTRTQLSRVKVSPMVNRLREVRTQLSFGSVDRIPSVSDVDPIDVLKPSSSQGVSAPISGAVLSWDDTQGVGRRASKLPSHDYLEKNVELWINERTSSARRPYISNRH